MRCYCTPRQLCTVCENKGFTSSLAGYASRIYPQQVTEQEMKDYDDQQLLLAGIRASLRSDGYGDRLIKAAERKREIDRIGARYQPNQDSYDASLRCASCGSTEPPALHAVLGHKPVTSGPVCDNTWPSAGQFWTDEPDSEDI